MINVSNEICEENQNTHFMFSNFFPKNYAIYTVVLKNVVPMHPFLPHTHTQMCKICCFYTATVVTLIYTYVGFSCVSLYVA
jgi:hypothetical protein